MTAGAWGGCWTIHEGPAPTVWPWSVEWEELRRSPPLPWTWSRASGSLHFCCRLLPSQRHIKFLVCCITEHSKHTIIASCTDIESRSQWAECVGLDLYSTVLGFLCVRINVAEIAQHTKICDFCMSGNEQWWVWFPSGGICYVNLYRLYIVYGI